MNLAALLFRTAPLKVLAATFVAALSGIASAALVAIISYVLGGHMQDLHRWAWIFVALALVALVSRIASQIILVHLAQGAIFQLRMQLSRQILSVPLADLERTGPPRLLAALTEDVVTIAEAIQGLPFLCFSLATVVGCLAYLAWLSWSVTLSVILLMAPGVFAYQALQRRALSALRRARDSQDSLFEAFRGITDGAKELKLHQERRLAFLESAVQASAHRSRQQNFLGISLFSVAGAWSQLLLLALVGGVVFLLPTLVDVDAATVTGYSLTILYMLRPVDFILHILPALARSSISLKKIDALGLTLSHAAQEPPSPEPPLSGDWQPLELIGVQRTYKAADEDRHFTLGPLDLALEPGEILFITGGNGSGKSTLVKVLVGLYPPDQGTITLAGKTIDESRRDWYRQHFSVVFADFYLFYQLYGLDPTQIADRSAHYLSRLRLDRQVRVSGIELKTAGLSQGQRKRLALLTAYLEDRPIYVFDEWASDQDPSFKEIFYTQLLDELKRRGKSVVVVSHDDRYYHVADRVVKLEEGRVVEVSSRHLDVPQQRAPA